MNFERAIKSLKIISLAITLSVLLFMMVFLFLTQSADYEPSMVESRELWLIVMAVVIGVAYGLAEFASSKLISASANDKAGTRSAQYRVATIVRFAVYEMAAMVACVFFYFTGHLGHLILAVLVFGLMIRNWPNAIKARKALKLTDEELSEL